MAQPHKGPRAQIKARVTEAVYNEIRARAADRGVPMSQYLADVMAVFLDMPDEVRELRELVGEAPPEVLPLAM